MFDLAVDLSWQTLLILSMVAMVAGFVDAIAGGGGLLTIPAMLVANVPLLPALATNKLQATAGSFSASVAMIRKGVIRPIEIKSAIIMAFMGAMLGTLVVSLSPPDMLKKIIPFLLGFIGIYTLFAPNLGDIERTPKLSKKVWQKTVVPLIGFYDGYIGPGTGMFFSLSGVGLLGMQIIRATGVAKVLNFATNLASLVVFIIGGQVLWLLGISMMIGQAIGAYFGSQMAIKGGVTIIRPMIVLMCFAMLIKYIFFT